MAGETDFISHAQRCFINCLASLWNERRTFTYFLRNNRFKVSIEGWTLRFFPSFCWFSALFPFWLPNRRNHPLETFYSNGLIYFQVYGFYWKISWLKIHFFSPGPSFFPHIYTASWDKWIYFHLKPIYLHFIHGECPCPWAEYGVVQKTDVGATVDMSGKTKCFLTIAKQKKKKGLLCSKSATWLKLELGLRPWPQLFYPFPCREVPLGHWLILYWMGYRPLTYLISGSGPEHNSLFIGASEKVIWTCRLWKVKLKPKAFHSNQFSKMYSPWVNGESSHGNMLC